jgi:K+-transporting ATPase A subunit
MLVPDLVQPLLLLCAVLALTPPLGGHIARIMGGEPTLLDPVAGPLERLVYRGLRLDPARGQTWKGYARSLLVFSLASIAELYLLQRFQGLLPANPGHLGALEPFLALITAVSFATNTNWQNYAGEATMSHLTQMAGLATQNFDGPRRVATVGGATQALPGGPVASQEAIKELGTNGGGPLNANSAHPYENPDPVTNFLELLAPAGDPVRPHRHLRPAGRLAPPGLGAVRGHGRHLGGQVPAGPGTFPTHTPLFVGLLVSVVVIVGALTFLAVLALGPLVEHLLQGTGQLF